jgi:hypothetical protein
MASLEKLARPGESPEMAWEDRGKALGFPWILSSESGLFNELCWLPAAVFFLRRIRLRPGSFGQASRSIDREGHHSTIIAPAPLFQKKLSQKNLPAAAVVPIGLSSSAWPHTRKHQDCCEGAHWAPCIMTFAPPLGPASPGISNAAGLRLSRLRYGMDQCLLKRLDKVL